MGMTTRKKKQRSGEESNKGEIKILDGVVRESGI